jgi:hypothetical protein
MGLRSAAFRSQAAYHFTYFKVTHYPYSCFEQRPAIVFRKSPQCPQRKM